MTVVRVLILQVRLVLGFFFFFSLNLRVRSEQGNFCLLGLFSGSSFVLTQVDNRVLTADEKLQLIVFCSGSNSFFLDTARFLVDLSHSWELLSEEIINFSMRNLHTKS